MTRNKKYRTLAIVPARGGSKSIPYKNIVNLGGRPLISYCIKAIKKSRSVDRLIVTTDDPKIAKVSKKYGAEVPFLRPAELAEDDTPTIPVIEHALKWLDENENYQPDFVLLIQPTEPFVTSEQIDGLFNLMISKKADSGITIVPVPRTNHPYHIRHLTDGYLEHDNPELHYKHPNRQSDPKRYAFGNLYWFRRDKFLKERKIEVGRRVGLEIDPLAAHGIDDKSDLELARFLVRKLQHRK